MSEVGGLVGLHGSVRGQKNCGWNEGITEKSARWQRLWTAWKEKKVQGMVREEEESAHSRASREHLV
jgi:hypothetical protein